MSAAALRCGVVINRLGEVTAQQTTWLIACEAARRGHAVWILGVGDLELSPDGSLTALAGRVPADAATEGGLERLIEGAPQRIVLDGLDALLIRTSPARDLHRAWAHAALLVLAQRLKERGVVVLNDPVGLARASSKLYVAEIPPAFRPRTLVTRDLALIRDFVASCPGGAVLKPIEGTRGQDVFILRPGARGNLNQIVDVLTRGGFAMAQEFVPEAIDGDMRLVLVDGRPLEVDGVYAAVRRIPTGDDLRSNVHVGATVAPGVVGPGHLAAAAAVGSRLRRDGLWLAGLDLIGDKIIEVNVFSTGGLHDADRFGGVSFIGAVVDHLERHVAAVRQVEPGTALAVT